MLSLLVREKNFAQNELKKYIRHIEFIKIMEKYNHSEKINWECYWSWFYNSNISADEALRNSIE